MKQKLDRETIASRVAKEFRDGDVVNLGAGIPTLCAHHVPKGKSVWFQSENGVLGYGGLAEEEDQQSADLLNASGQFITTKPGISFFSSADAFNMIRGGHVNIAVLGAYQVSEKGDLANWMIPGRGTGNVGGAMELVSGVQRVIVAMEHATREGEPKLVPECAYPLTGRGCVDLVVTDLGVIDVSAEGLSLLEIAPGFDPEEVQAKTAARLNVSPDLKEIGL